MCYSMPGLIEAVEGDRVTIRYFKQRREAINDGLDGLAVGDYVYAQNGIVIRKVERGEAGEILRTWRELFSFLEDEDKRQSQMPTRLLSDTNFGKILLRAGNGSKLSDNELLFLLSVTSDEEIALISRTANNIRHLKLGNSCCVHGILEFSSFCRCDCLYCGIRASNQGVRRLRLSDDEIVSAALRAVEVHGFKTLVLQSGEDEDYSDDDLIRLVRIIRASCGVLLFVSVGERSEEC